MNNISGLTLGLSLIGLVLLVVFLVAIFYRPAKRLNVTCNFKSGSDEKQDAMLLVNLENVGKRKLKLQAPFIRFSHTTHSKRYQAKPETLSCNFPRSIKIGEKQSFELNLGHFKTQLEKIAFNPTHVKIIINDFAGLDFESQSLTFKI
jgi:hypothetical protein